jgi:hypothetical protein
VADRQRLVCLTPDSLLHTVSAIFVNNSGIETMRMALVELFTASDS